MYLDFSDNSIISYMCFPELPFIDLLQAAFLRVRRMIGGVLWCDGASFQLVTMLVFLELSWKKLNSVLLFSLFSNISKTNKSTFVTLLKFGNDTPVGNYWIDKYYVTNQP